MFRVDYLMNKLSRSRLSALLTILFFTFFIPLELSAYGDDKYITLFPDNTNVRREFKNYFIDPISSIADGIVRTYPAKNGQSAVRFLVSRTSTHLNLEFLSTYSGLYKADNPGSFIIKRQIRTGAIDTILISLSKNPQIYTSISPRGSHSEISVFIEGIKNPVYRRIPLPVSIGDLSFKPLSEILSQTKGRILWQHLLDVPDNGYFKAVEFMIDSIRKALPGLPDGEDGAQDEFGQLTTISDIPIGGPMGLNCSGFAKWVADGIYVFLNKESSIHNPLATGPGYLNIDNLKERHLDLRGNSLTKAYEVTRDPFFGLDWIRNIAVSLHKARTHQRQLSLKDRDVDSIPFLDFVENKGYDIKNIEVAMYLLALKEPGNFYLAAINGETGTNPRLWQYYHIAILFPYFDKNGSFKTVVFERNVESSTASLLRRYTLEKAFLTKIRASQDFLSPAIK